MCASTEEFFSSMCTGVGDKTVSNEGEKTCRTVLLILVDEANMKKKNRDSVEVASYVITGDIFKEVSSNKRLGFYFT